MPYFFVSLISSCKPLSQCRSIASWSEGLHEGDHQVWRLFGIFVWHTLPLLCYSTLHCHLWKLYTYIAYTCRTDWVQQQSRFNAAQRVLDFFFAFLFLFCWWPLGVSVYIYHRLYRRCFYVRSRVEVHTSVSVSSLWREFLQCPFFFFFVTDEYVCTADAPTCEDIKWIAKLLYSNWCVRNATRWFLCNRISCFA